MVAITEISVRKAFALNGFFVLLAVALLLAFAHPASAAQSQSQNFMSSGVNTLSGKVINIDPAEKTVTVKTKELGPSLSSNMPETLNVFTNDKTSISSCTESGSLAGLKPDKNVTISYQEIGGVPVASSISEEC